MFKRLLLIIVLSKLSLLSFSQILSDSASARARINSQIVPNGTQAITAQKLNWILNGYLNFLTRYSVDSIKKVGDSIYYQKFGTWFAIYKDETGGGGGGADSTNSSITKNISDLRATNYHLTASLKKDADDKPMVNVAGYYNRGDGGGGLFYWDDTAALADNNGTIIKPTSVSGNGRWKRLAPNNEVSVLWFGAKPTDNIADATINGNAFRAARNSITKLSYSSVLKGGGVIYVPRGIYFMDTTFVLNAGITLKGDAGHGLTVESMLKFGSIISSGILVQTADGTDGRTGGGCIIENIAVSSYYLGTFDTTAHGFKIKGTTTLRNCYAEFFPGDGFNFDTDAATPGVDGFGNSAFSLVERCRAHNNRNGFYTHGGDANVIEFNTCDATTNRQWGFWENGFLGNTYINCHVADNTYQSFNKAQVTHGGGHYIAITYSTGIEPGVTSGWQNYWVDVGSPFDTYFSPWSVDSTYWGGGGYNSFPGDNGNNMYLNCYQEGGQPSQWGYRSMVIGGDLAAAMLPKNNGEMRFAAAGGKYVFYTAFEYSNNEKSQQVTRISEEGIQMFPHVNQSNASYALRKRYDTIGLKFIEDYVNSSFPVYEVPSTLADPSDFGLGAIKTGIPSYPQGMFINRLEGGNKRLFSLGTGRPSSGAYAAGDVVLNAAGSSSNRHMGWRNTTSGSPGTWQTIFMPVDSIYVVDSNFYGYRQAGAQYLVPRSSGGSGVTGSATAGQGTFWTGSTSVGGHGSFLVDPTSATPYYFNTNSSSPIAGTYYQMARIYASNASNGNIMQFLFGKADNSNDAANFAFHYASSTSNSNFLGIGFYGNDDKLNIFGSGNVVIGSTSDIGVKFFNNGTSHFAGNTGFGTTTLTSLVNIGSNADFQVTSAGKVAKYANTTPINGYFPIGHTANATLELGTITSTGGTMAVQLNAGNINLEVAGAESTYSPTLFNTTNIAASTAFTTHYKRVGNWVNVWGEVDIDATTTLTISELGLSLPVASAIGNTYEIAGTAVFEDNTSVQIKGDATNDRAIFRFTPVSVANNKYSFNFSYKVL